MNKIKGLSFFKTDKDIFDQLTQRTPSKTSVLEHLKQRGLLVSHQEERQDLAEMISPWFTSYFDQKFIVNELGGGNSQKKHNSTEIVLDYNAQDIQDILKEIKKDNSFIISQRKDGSFDITETYTKVDFTKNVLSQNTQKTAEIKIQKTEQGHILIRTNADEKANTITEVIKEKMKEKNADNYQEFEINLSTITEPANRTQFFLELINNIDGYKLIDVTSAFINKNTTQEEVDAETVGFIKKIALNGDSVHTSSEFQRLTNDGFYLTKIEWTIQSEVATGDKIDLSAEFTDTINCSDFKYGVKRVYTAKGNGEYTAGKPPSESDRMVILPKIELSARQSYDKISPKISDQIPEADEDSQVV